MREIAVVGLGYVGLPVAVAFGKKGKVIGFDISQKRIQALKNGIDVTEELKKEDLSEANIEFTSDASKLQCADFIIVAVPTPITDGKRPDLTPLTLATEMIGANLKKGSIVVFESTVYPGATEEVCVPILEEKSGLKCGVDFFVGYSPERINPGDKEHTFESIKKVVGGQDEATCELIAQTYEKVVVAGVHRVSSIKVAEAAKVIENTQRDLNIALMNELAIIFEKLGIDTQEVLKAAGTKWNFIPFTPGLVGGHCIGVDPYYLTYKAEKIGYHPQVILAGRRINDSMGSFIATTLVKQMIHHHIQVQGATVTVLGLAFKENVPDLRNSRVIDLIRELEEFGVKVTVNDVLVDKKQAYNEYGIELVDYQNLQPSDAVVLAVPHAKYIQSGWNEIKQLLKNEKGIVFDIKGKLPKEEKPAEISLWRL